MQQTTEQRLAELESMTSFLHAHCISLQTTLIAALHTINRAPESKAYFTAVLKGAVDGSYAIGTNWSDQTIDNIKRGVGVMVGKDIAEECGLPRG